MPPLSFLQKIQALKNQFSLTEKALCSIFFVALTVSLLGIAVQINTQYTVPVARPGGTLIEGIIGFPRFINPLFAFSDADRDLTALIYSGLLKYEPDGALIPDIAESYTISGDGLTYTFIIKKDATFQDGTAVTTNDILFTVGRAQDPNIKSPKRANWEGVTVEKKSDREVVFNLRQPFAPFLENTTIGILPSHLWKTIDPEQFIFSDLNIQPIGSGPYRVVNITRDSAGRPSEYTLHSYKKYPLGKPFIKNIIAKFYQSEEEVVSAFKKCDIETLNGISPANAKLLESKGIQSHIERIPLPRVFSVFFNQNQAQGLFANKEVRSALNMVVDRGQIIDEVFSGYATAVDSPIPPNLSSESLESATVTTTSTSSIKSAQTLLEKNGWVKNLNGIYEKKVKKEQYRLAFSLSIPNVPELKAVADTLKTTWEKIGAQVTIKIFEQNDFTQTVLRPRNFEALLFGEIVGRDIDLFAFWHSSQRNDPGLNIALYANIKTDKLLSEARTLRDPADRLSRYVRFEEEIKKDIPAIFLYTPNFIYITPEKMGGVSLVRVTTAAERFLGIRNWYLDTDTVWKQFETVPNRNRLEPLYNILTK